MIVHKKYRFKLVNLCDVNTTYTASAVGQFGTTNIVIGAHTFAAGDYAYFEDFDGPANGYRKIESVDATTVRILIPAAIDTDILGTVKKINERYVEPLNFHDSKFDWEREPDEIFFRQLLNDPLKFQQDDYRYMASNILANPCCESKMIIEKKCGSQWTEAWRGYFSHNSCKWNQSHCTVEVTMEPDDYYRCLFYGYEDKKTIFESLQYFERLECCGDATLPLAGGGSCSPPCGGLLDLVQDDGGGEYHFIEQQLMGPCDDSSMTDWQMEKTIITQITFTGESLENFHICTTWIREVSITLDVDGEAVSPVGTGWVQRETVNYNGLPAHKWTRFPYGGAYNTYSDYSVVRDCDGLPCTRTWSVTYPDTPDSSTTQISLADVLSTLTSFSCGTIQGVISDFFEINPPGDTPGYVSGVNYVTGAASQISNLRVQQLSAYLTVISGSVSEITSDLALKELLDALKTAFNCKWFVNEDGYLRIEHISWFQRVATADTTTGHMNVMLNKSKKHFSFDRVEIPLREKFTWVYQGYLDFIGKDIKYNSVCVNLKKTVTHSVAKFSTDLRHVRDNANEFKDFNSFLLLACDVDNSVLTEAGILTGEDQQNGHLSWANLHENYHRYDRYLINGTMNDTDTTFETAKKTKRQVPVVYYNNGCCDVIDPLTDLVTTEMGDGQVDKMSKSNRDESFTFELMY